MMATKGMGSTVVLNVLLWLSLVISIPLSGFRPVYVTVAIVGAILLGLMAALVVGLTRAGSGPGASSGRSATRSLGRRRTAGEHRAAGRRGAAPAGRDRGVMTRSLIWAALNWLLDAASLWLHRRVRQLHQPVGLFAAYGIANVLGAIPITPAGLGVIDSVTPVLLVSFGLTRSVATLACWPGGWSTSGCRSRPARRPTSH